MFKDPLLPGSTLSIGGKEIEVDAVITREEFMAGRPFLKPMTKRTPSIEHPTKRTPSIENGIKRTLSIEHSIKATTSPKFQCIEDRKARSSKNYCIGQELLCPSTNKHSYAGTF